MFKIKSFEGKISDIEKEWEGFRPIECMKCKNRKNLQSKLFSINKQPKTIEEEQELKEQLKTLGIDHFTKFSDGRTTLILTAKCPKCGSQSIFWDF